MKRGNFSKAIVGVVVLAVMAYTAASLFISLNGGVVPDSLTYSFYGFMGAEAGLLGLIKANKIKNNGSQSEEGDKDE